MDFKEALEFRHACKIFDEAKIIEEKAFMDILEAARLSPSSFGLEHWEFEVIVDKNLREKLKSACWGQAQITTASHLIVIYAKISDLYPKSPYVHLQFSRKTNHKQSEIEAYISRYASFFERFIDQRDVFGWSKSQCFLAAQNIMMQAAILGIDSCAIEGFDENALNEALQINPQNKRVAMLVALGYRTKPAQAKIRQNLNDIVKFR